MVIDSGSGTEDFLSGCVNVHEGSHPSFPREEVSLLVPFAPSSWVSTRTRDPRRSANKVSLRTTKLCKTFLFQTGVFSVD